MNLLNYNIKWISYGYRSDDWNQPMISNNFAMYSLWNIFLSRQICTIRFKEAMLFALANLHNMTGFS